MQLKDMSERSAFPNAGIEWGRGPHWRPTSSPQTTFSVMRLAFSSLLRKHPCRFKLVGQALTPGQRHAAGCAAMRRSQNFTTSSRSPAQHVKPIYDTTACSSWQTSSCLLCQSFIRAQGSHWQVLSPRRALHCGYTMWAGVLTYIVQIPVPSPEEATTWL